jgi:glyoxylase-like metal-dependent hydrolase (beta-lactamase superfamily II)
MYHRFKTALLDSNCYIIENYTNKIIIIDPGDPDINPLTSCITSNNKQIAAVFLTHEHADHCSGLNALYHFQPFKLFCSQACATNIGNCKQNFSFYMDTIQSFEVHIPAQIIHDGEPVTLNNTTFTFHETPGHSPGSFCIFTSDAVFTGDTLLNNTKTPLTFPHSNRKDYSNSIQKLKTLIKPGTTIYPGHGEAFLADD